MSNGWLASRRSDYHLWSTFFFLRQHIKPSRAHVQPYFPFSCPSHWLLPLSSEPLFILCFVWLDGMTDIVYQICRLRPSTTRPLDSHHYSNRTKPPSTTTTAISCSKSASASTRRDAGLATTPAQQIHWPELAFRLAAHWPLPIRHPQRIYFRPWHTSTSKRP